MVSRIAILSVLAAVALAQTPTQSETPALQSFLSVSNLDASQADQISTAFAADIENYYSGLMTAPEWSSFYLVVSTGVPASALSSNAADPGLFVASLAQADEADLPDWFTALPTPQQEYLESMGSGVIELYTSEVDKARPVPSSVSASLTSAASSISSAMSSASAESTKLKASKTQVVAKGGAPASPVTSGHMAVVAGGVAIAAGLIGLVML
ncbi:MAG: hypothetical protein LQ352_006504 [Teloschistes flavicans]|nr:MAG: hypothetical protein LQ352_006504 [Teloschistes flavicans]